MKLLTISFVVVWICFGLPGCINARIFSDDNNDSSENNQMQATSEPQNEFLLFVTPKKFSISKYFKKNEYKNYYLKHDKYNQDVTFNCEEKKIYVLSKDDSNDKKKAVQSISYDENKKFKNLNKIINMFDNATSIAAEWTTDRIFWIENSKKSSAIKVTDKLFSEPEYIVHPDDGFVIKKIQVYPKRNIIFFSTNNYLWYTSTEFIQKPKLVISPSVSFTKILDFTIDYSTDKLYWISLKKKSYLFCIDIGTSDKQLEVDDIKAIKIISNYAFNLVIFNKSIYWTTLESNNNKLKLFYKNDNTNAVEVADLPLETKLFSISLTCPSVEMKEHLVDNYNDWYWVLPQS